MAGCLVAKGIDIDERWVRPVGSWVLESGNVVAQALAVSLDKPLEWAVGFFFGNVELSLEYNLGHIGIRRLSQTSSKKVINSP